MSFPTVIYGPEGEVFNDYAATSPVPGNNGVGGQTARRAYYPLGQQLVLANGRKFRFAVALSTLVVGDLLSGPVATASQQNRTAAAGAVGDRLATLTTGASSAVNTFAEGFLNVSVAPGAGQIYLIGSHAVMTSGAGDTVNFAQGHSIRVATTTTSRYDLIQNNFYGVLQTPATTVASAPMGVCLKVVTTGRGTWIQTRGPASILTSGVAIAGNVVAPGLGTGGAVGPIADNAQDTQPPIGFCMFAAASGAWSTIYLMIDG